MTKCERQPDLSCPTCGARPGEDCPLSEPLPSWLEGKPIGGVSGVCNTDGTECESCQ